MNPLEPKAVWPFIYKMIIIVLLLSIGDVFLTNYIISTGGMEINPLLIPIVEACGPIIGLLIAKVPGFAMVAASVVLVHKHHSDGGSRAEKWLMYCMILSVCVYSAIVAWSLSSIIISGAIV